MNWGGAPSSPTRPWPPEAPGPDSSHGEVARFMREKRAVGAAAAEQRVESMPEQLYNSWLGDAKKRVKAKHQTSLQAFRAFADILVDGSTLGMSIDALVYGLQQLEVPIRDEYILKLWPQLQPSGLGGPRAPGGQKPKPLVYFHGFSAVFR